MDESGDSELLRKGARCLYGDDWPQHLAPILSTRPPERPPGGVSVDLLGEWASGRRRPPLWVVSAMANLLVENIDTGHAHDADLRALLASVNSAIRRALETGWDGSDGVKITIVGPEARLLTEMINSQPTEPITIAPGVTLTWQVPLAKDAHGFGIIDVVIFLGQTVVPGVVSSLIAAWIMSRFRGKAERLTINTKECEFDEGKICKTIEKTITYERE